MEVKYNRIPQKEKIDLTRFKLPDSSFPGYSYADYLTWDFEEIVELIKGRVFVKPPFPGTRHQEILLKFFLQINKSLPKGTGELYYAPFDVRFGGANEDGKIVTVVQPDICLILDPIKLDERGCFGSPDLIIEILSKGNNTTELQEKYELYQEFGVKEYWIIHPVENTLQINVLVNGGYQPSRLFTTGQKVTSTVLPGFELALEEVFEES
jgi:Uma2 family endonuclease